MSRLQSPQEQRALFPWYNPVNYESVDEFDAIRWWIALSFRAVALVAEGDALDQRFSAIRDNPLALHHYPSPSRFPVQDTTFIEWRKLSNVHKFSQIANRVDRWLTKYRDVSDDFYWAHVYFTGAPRLISLHSLVVRYLSKPRGLSEQTVADMESLLRNATVTVDLTAPDANLEEAFKHWLAQKRASMNLAGCSLAPTLAKKKAGLKQFSATDFSRWSSRRVLDYLDIKISCRASGKPLPSGPELSRLIPYRDVVDPYESFKETRKLAKDLIRPDFLIALHGAGLVNRAKRQTTHLPKS